MRTLGFALIALLLGGAWQALQIGLVHAGIISGDPLSRDAGIVTMFLFLSLMQWFHREER